MFDLEEFAPSFLHAGFCLRPFLAHFVWHVLILASHNLQRHQANAQSYSYSHTLSLSHTQNTKMVSKGCASQKTAAELWHESFSCDAWGDADLEDLITGNFVQGTLPDDENNGNDGPDLTTVVEKLEHTSLSNRTLDTEQTSSSSISLGSCPIESELSAGRRNLRRQRSGKGRKLSGQENAYISPENKKKAFALSGLTSPRREGRRRAPPAKSKSVTSPTTGDRRSRLGRGRPSSSRNLMGVMPENSDLCSPRKTPSSSSTSRPAASFGSLRSPGFLRRSKSKSMRNLMNPVY